MSNIPIIDLGKEYLSLKPEIARAIERVLAGGSYILGQETQEFEKELAAYCGVKHAIGVNSGTDAIHLALRTLEIGPGDDVILPAMSFIATAEPIVLLGARPVFVDIDPRTYTLDPEKVKQKITPKTKAIIAVHLYGQPADMETLSKISVQARVPLIEDMAQAIGAEQGGKRAGGFGVLACLSFFPTKNLGACGDGGAVLTSSHELAERLRQLRNHGAKIKYHHEAIGYNSRLDEIQSAILRIKLKHLEAWNDQRQKLAIVYSQELSNLPLTLPFEAKERKHVYHLYSIQTPQRDSLRDYLAKKRIATGLHYPTPLHLQPALKFLGGKRGDYPRSEQLADQTLSLPLHPHMSIDHVHRVVQSIRTFFKGV